MSVRRAVVTGVVVGALLPVPCGAFPRFIQAAYATSDVEVSGMVSSPSFWRTETPVVSGDAPLQRASSSSAGSSVSSPPSFRQQQSSEPPLFSPPPSGEQGAGSSSAEEESPPSDPGDLVAEPIDISRPEGNALLLTAEELAGALARSVHTRAHLEELAKALVQSDKSVVHIETGESGLRMVYRHRAKLLGFIPLSYKLDTTVDARGQVHIGKPWWLFLASDHAAEIAQQLQNRVIEDKLILGNLLKVPDLHERGQSIMEVLAAIARHAYDAHTSNV